MPLHASVARFNRRVTNPLLIRAARWLPGFAILVHRGRRSGKLYRIPMIAFRQPGGYRMALTYGAETDWVRNVLAAGGCELIVRGRSLRLVAPRVGTDPEVGYAPSLVRMPLKLARVVQYLELSFPADAPPGDARGARTDTDS